MPAMWLRRISTGGPIMSGLEVLLKLSLIRAELLALGAAIDPQSARVVTYAANVLKLVADAPANDVMPLPSLPTSR